MIINLADNLSMLFLNSSILNSIFVFCFSKAPLHLLGLNALIGDIDNFFEKGEKDVDGIYPKLLGVISGFSFAPTTGGKKGKNG